MTASNDTMPLTNGISKDERLEESSPQHDETSIPPADAHPRPEYMKSITVPLNTDNAFTPKKKLRVVTIGCGYAGATLAQKLQHAHQDMGDLVEHTIIEAKSDAGGTWIANTYPGVRLRSKDL